MTIAAVVISASGGCLSGHTFVLEKPMATAGQVRYGAVSVREGESSTTIEEEQRESFRSALIDALTPEQPGADAGEEPAVQSAVLPDDAQPLTLEYRFVLHESGSGPVRIGAFLVSLIGVPVNALGTGAVGVEAAYFDGRGRRLAHIVVDGPIDGPGGSTDSGLATAAEQIAEFTRKTFGATAMPPTIVISP